jgi:2-oxoglutarate ferredoxin oxidoreductase subunit gamma
MMVKTIFSGFGGQGVLMTGYSFAHGAMSAGYHVTYLPSYGAEVRGGTANCTVAVADEEIASPVASEPDYIVALNNPSVQTFQNKIASGGSMFLNSSIIEVYPSRKDIIVYEIPAGEISENLGNPRAANIVMMGALLKTIGLVPPEIYLKSLEIILGKKKRAIMETNEKAFHMGYDFLTAPKKKKKRS